MSDSGTFGSFGGRYVPEPLQEPLGGAHKLNNTLGQALLAKRMGKTRLIAETGAGQHGTATAMVGALLDMDTQVYMGRKDMQRQEMNVFRMGLMGAEVTAVTRGNAGLA